MEIINASNIGKYVKSGDRILVITRPFRPYIFYDFISRLTLGFYRKYFDYQANPRDLDYLTKRTWKLFSKLMEGRPRAVDWCLPGFGEEKKLVPNYFTELPRDLSGYDAFILIYPDSLGLGFRPIERRLLKEKKPLVAVNGRNRFFEFRSARRRLYWRRFSEKSLVFEFLFSLVFVLAAPFYLAFSVFKPRPAGWRKIKISEGEYLSRQGRAKLADVSDIRNFWDKKPMTYGDEHGEAKFKGREVGKGGKEFFEEADRKFYSWNKPLHRAGRPFAKIFDYDKYKGKNVLEIGCGMGTMAMNWAKNGAKVTAVDLTEEAVARTKERFGIYGLEGNILRADARSLPFKDAQFDYVYSWGVLHHSPELKRSLREMSRVLKDGGEAGVMLYNRDSFFHLFLTGFREGFLHLENEFLSPLELASRYGDDYVFEGNPHTWPVKLDEINYLFGDFADADVRVLGTDLDYVFLRTCPFIAPLIPKFIKKAYARRYGWSLWITAKK